MAYKHSDKQVVKYKHFTDGVEHSSYCNCFHQASRTKLVRNEWKNDRSCPQTKERQSREEAILKSNF